MPNIGIPLQLKYYRQMHQQQQQKEKQQLLQQQQQQQRKQPQSQVQQQQHHHQWSLPRPMAWSELMKRSRPGSTKTKLPPCVETPPSRDHTSQGPVQNVGNQPTSGSGRQGTPFLKKKQKRNIILDDGDGPIPFSATRELYKYEMFVTNIARNSNVDDIKSHLIKKLGTDDVSIKPMSKSTASYLSFGVFCRSERDDLDFWRTGLWPKYTVIYKWNSKAGDTRANNRAPSYQGQARSRGSQGARGSYYKQDKHSNNVRRVNSGNTYHHRYPDQQRLHDQHNG